MSTKELMQVALLTEHALFNVRFAAEEERKVTHSKHISGFYRELINQLESKLDAERAVLTRNEALGIKKWNKKPFSLLLTSTTLPKKKQKSSTGMKSLLI